MFVDPPSDQSIESPKEAFDFPAPASANPSTLGSRRGSQHFVGGSGKGGSMTGHSGVSGKGGAPAAEYSFGVSTPLRDRSHTGSYKGSRGDYGTGRTPSYKGGRGDPSPLSIAKMARDLDRQKSNDPSEKKSAGSSRTYGGYDMEQLDGKKVAAGIAGPVADDSPGSTINKKFVRQTSLNPKNDRQSFSGFGKGKNDVLNSGKGMRTVTILDGDEVTPKGKGGKGKNPEYSYESYWEYETESDFTPRKSFDTYGEITPPNQNKGQGRKGGSKGRPPRSPAQQRRGSFDESPGQSYPPYAQPLNRLTTPMSDIDGGGGRNFSASSKDDSRRGSAEDRRGSAQTDDSRRDSFDDESGRVRKLSTKFRAPNQFNPRSSIEQGFIDGSRPSMITDPDTEFSPYSHEGDDNDEQWHDSTALSPRTAAHIAAMASGKLGGHQPPNADAARGYSAGAGSSFSVGSNVFGLSPSGRGRTGSGHSARNRRGTQETDGSPSVSEDSYDEDELHPPPRRGRAGSVPSMAERRGSAMSVEGSRSPAPKHETRGSMYRKPPLPPRTPTRKAATNEKRGSNDSPSTMNKQSPRSNVEQSPASQADQFAAPALMSPVTTPGSHSAKQPVGNFLQHVNATPQSQAEQAKEAHDITTARLHDIITKMEVEIPHQEYALPQNDDMLRREEEEGIGMVQASAERRAKAEEEVKKAEALLAAAKLKAAETDASVDPIQMFFDQDAEDRAQGICRRHVDFAVEQMLFTKRHESR